MKIPLEKIKAMILYFAAHTDSSVLGKTKLMKLFYFADFGFVKKHGVPITNDRYKNMEHGPVPMTIFNLLSTAYSEPDESLVSDVVELRKEENGMHRVIARKDFADGYRKLFSISELKHMGEVCNRFYSANKREIEEASHKEHPWSDTNLLEDIPYKFAARDKDSETTEEEVDFAMRLLK